jgi:hypothetical protein
MLLLLLLHGAVNTFQTTLKCTAQQHVSLTRHCFNVACGGGVPAAA